jgi:hypothetical protein
VAQRLLQLPGTAFRSASLHLQQRSGIMENGLRPVNPLVRFSLRAQRRTEENMCAASATAHARTKEPISSVRTKAFVCILRTVQPAKPHVDASPGHAAELPPAGSELNRDKQARFIGVPP